MKVEVLKANTESELTIQIDKYKMMWPFAGYSTTVGKPYFDKETNQWKANAQRNTSCD